MTLAMMLVITVAGTFAIYKLLIWSRNTGGNKIANAGALAIALMMLFVVGSLANSSDNPKPEHRTLGLTGDDFNQRFMANINALASSMGIDDIQAATMTPINREKNSFDEEKLTYQLGDELYLIEVVNTDNQKLKGVIVKSSDKESIWARLAEAAYVASIKAVNPQFTADDFSKLHDDLFSGDATKTITYKKFFYSRRVNNSEVEYRIYAEENYFTE